MAVSERIKKLATSEAGDAGLISLSSVFQESDSFVTLINQGRYGDDDAVTYISISIHGYKKHGDVAVPTGEYAIFIFENDAAVDGVAAIASMGLGTIGDSYELIMGYETLQGLEPFASNLRSYGKAVNIGVESGVAKAVNSNRKMTSRKGSAISKKDFIAIKEKALKSLSSKNKPTSNPRGRK